MKDLRNTNITRAATALVLLLGLAACGGDEDAGEDEAPAGIRVTVESLSEVASQVQASAPGRMLSLNDTLISAEIGARVEKILHRRGDTVDMGTVLIELDCSLYKYRLDGAQSRLSIALSDRKTQISDFKRHTELYEQGLISEEMYLAKKNAAERSKGNASLARSELNVAKRDVENCSVRAPFDATVMEVHPAVGELLQPGARLARIVDISSIEVWADLNPRYASGLKAGSKARFAQNQTEIPIELVSISSLPDLSTGNYKTRFRLLGPLPKLVGSGEVLWTTTERFLDSVYLRESDGGYGIMVAEDGIARFAPIEEAREGWYIPVAGLSGQTQLIARGRGKVKHGDPLDIYDAEEEAAAEALRRAAEAKEQADDSSE